MRVSLLLVGLGNIGRRFCELLIQKRELLRARYNLDLCLVGAADSHGTAYDPQNGLDPERIVSLKSAGGTIAAYPVVGRPGQPALELVAEAQADVLLEASPVNLWQGAEPALSCIRTALARGIHVVTSNKGPLVVAYRDLNEMASRHQAQLRFDGTVAGGLPALYLGQRDLRGAIVYRLTAVPNLTTSLVLDLLADGVSWEQAQKIAREQGVLEDDGTWDLEGWDAAAKLVIMANAVLGWPARLEDVLLRGIVGIGSKELLEARRRNCLYRLVAEAERLQNGGYALSVQPRALPPSHPLARLGRYQMGVVYETDIYGTITAMIEERTPLPSAATMLRDLLDIYLS